MTVNKSSRTWNLFIEAMSVCYRTLVTALEIIVVRIGNWFTIQCGILKYRVNVIPSGQTTDCADQVKQNYKLRSRFKPIFREILLSTTIIQSHFLFIFTSSPVLYVQKQSICVYIHVNVPGRLVIYSSLREYTRLVVIVRTPGELLVKANKYCIMR